ncbi:MAG: hypothetical protein MMC33_006001 [Icmadophila ericetorum]|nr:hypothetical protein [Icmadophila ericetorum]
MSGPPAAGSTPSSLDDLRVKTLRTISRDVPSQLNFVGKREEGSWPRNLLLPLIQVFPSLRDCFYQALCTVCKLSFMGTSTMEPPRKKVESISSCVATEFFEYIGPEKLRFTHHLLLSFPSKEYFGVFKILFNHDKSIFGFLRLLAVHIPQPRSLEHVSFSVEVEPSEPNSQARYTVNGLGGPQLTFTFPGRGKSSAIEKNDFQYLSAFIHRHRKPRRFNIMKLPYELRLMVYKKVFRSFRKRTLDIPASTWKFPEPPYERESTKIRDRLCISKDMYLELSRSLYWNTNFNFSYDWNVASGPNNWRDQSSVEVAPGRRDWPQAFLEFIGSSHVALIRHATISLTVCRYMWEIPSIRDLVNDLRAKSMIRFEGGWKKNTQLNVPSVKVTRDRIYVVFSAPTTDGTSLTLKMCFWKDDENRIKDFKVPDGVRLEFAREFLWMSLLGKLAQVYRFELIDPLSRQRIQIHPPQVLAEDI